MTMLIKKVCASRANLILTYAFLRSAFQQSGLRLQDYSRGGQTTPLKTTGIRPRERRCARKSVSASSRTQKDKRANASTLSDGLSHTTHTHTDADPDLPPLAFTVGPNFMQVLPAVTAPFKNAKKSILAKHAAMKKEQERKEKVNATGVVPQMGMQMPGKMPIDTPPSHSQPWSKATMSALVPMAGEGNGRSPVSPNSSPPTPVHGPSNAKASKRSSSSKSHHHQHQHSHHPKVASNSGIVKKGHKAMHEPKVMHTMVPSQNYARTRMCHFTTSGPETEEIQTGSSADEDFKGPKGDNSSQNEEHLDIGWLIPISSQPSQQVCQQPYVASRHDSGHGMQRMQHYSDSHQGNGVSDFCFADSAPHVHNKHRELTLRQHQDIEAHQQAQLSAYKRAHNEWSMPMSAQHHHHHHQPYAQYHHQQQEQQQMHHNHHHQQQQQMHMHHHHQQQQMQGYGQKTHQQAQQMYHQGHNGQEVVEIVDNSMDFLGSECDDGVQQISAPGGCGAQAEQQGNSIWLEFMS